MLYTQGKKKLKLLALLVALVSLPVLAGPAFAQVAPEEPIQGTIQVSEGDDYQALATITMDEAREAALAEVPGATFEEGELEEEDGFLVYDIELAHEGQDVEVTIDAGDGTVLAIEHDEDVDD